MNNEALLYIRVTVNGKRLNISLKKKIPLNIWNPKLKKAKGTKA
ncbi:Arm DNA-binding domain-containing protein [Lutibacter agarilyticus]